MPSCQPFRNAFDQESLYIPPGCEWSTIPEEFRALVPPAYLECYRNSKETLAKLAHSAEIASLKKWLLVLAENPVGLVVHHASVMGHEQLEVSVVGFLQGIKPWRQFYLPEENHWPTGEPLLDGFYKTTNGTLETEDAFCPSGWVHHRDLNYDWLGSDPRFPAEFQNALEIYKTDTGEKLFAFEGQCFRYGYDGSCVTLAGPLADVVEDYFLADLAGRRWAYADYP